MKLISVHKLCDICHNISLIDQEGTLTSYAINEGKEKCVDCRANEIAPYTTNIPYYTIETIGKHLLEWNYHGKVY